jgi:homoserine dehydrogenase
VTAIINGTTNYILTSMSKGGVGFAEALAAAQALGYAEADPTNDVEAHDAAYKLSILATLAFHIDVLPDDVYREGITKLGERDFAYARELGYAIKLLANVDGVLNAVQIEGDLMNRVLFQGPGAGSLPTTSAVVADALDAAVSISNRVYWPHSFRRESALHAMPMSDVRSRFYLRMRVADRPGVLARVAGVLSERAISIASVIQKEVDGQDTAEIVIMTHEAREEDLQRALGEIRNVDGVSDVDQVLRVKS